MIFWEYRVEGRRRSEFEEAYGAGGDWVCLFRIASGYLGSRLLRDVADAQAYFTIDTWVDRDSFEIFMASWEEQYQALDQRLRDLASRQQRLADVEAP